MLDDYLPPNRPRPRKRPRQSRSQMTVEDIMEAAAQLLVADERDALTTTRVAERAGVSVGTLYQYFSDLEELLAKLVEVHLARERDALEAVLQDAPSLSTAELVDRLVDAFTGVFAMHPKLSAALYDELRRASWGPTLDESGRDTASVVAQELQDRAGEIAPSDPALAAFVLVSSIDALVQRAAAQRPEELQSGAVAREAKQMARRYLLADPER
jgi:AcrR family transcriptional regulator